MSRGLDTNFDEVCEAVKCAGLAFRVCLKISSSNRWKISEMDLSYGKIRLWLNRYFLFTSSQARRHTGRETPGRPRRREQILPPCFSHNLAKTFSLASFLWVTY